MKTSSRCLALLRAVVLAGLPATMSAAAVPAGSASCLDISTLLPDATDLPAGWSIRPPGSLEASSTASQGVALVLASLRRSGRTAIAEADREVVTPEGTFQVAYALFPPPAKGSEAGGDPLRNAMTGSGVSGRFFGPVLLVAATSDRSALRLLSSKLLEKMSRELLEATTKAEAAGDLPRVVECAGEFLSANPRNAAVHLTLGEFLLFRANPPDPAAALGHFGASLDPAADPALPASDRWRALHDKGQVEGLLSRPAVARQTLAVALQAADTEEQRAATEYQIATVEAALGHRSQALESLRRCFDMNRRAGRPVPADMAARDGSFSGFASDPDFKKLLHEYLDK